MGSLISCLGLTRSRSSDRPVNRPFYLRANSQLPFIIDKVPRDIILAILHEVCDGVSLQGHLRCVRMLCSVCSTWRHWVLEDTSFWTQIYVSGYPASDDLRDALTNSLTRLIDIGVDLSTLPNAFLTKYDARSSSAIFSIIDAHLWHTIGLTLTIDARLFDAMHTLRSRAGSLQRLTISVRNTDAVEFISPQRPRFLSEAMPQLARLSVYGLPYSIVETILVPSLRVVEFHPRHLTYDDFTGLFRACPLLEDVYIRDLCIHAHAGEVVPLASIAASHLKSLRIEGVHRDNPYDTSIITAEALSKLPLDRIQTISLDAVTGQALWAEARTCFRTLGSLRSLEYLRETIEEDWSSASITAITPRGMKRRVHVFILDVDVHHFVSTVRAPASGQRTLSHLSIPVDWALIFLHYTDCTLSELQTLTLTYNLGHFYPSRDPPPAPASAPTSCPLLEEVILNVTDASVLYDLMSLLKRVLFSIIAFDAAPHPATLVLSRSFARAGRSLDIDVDALKARFQNTRNM